MQKFMLARSHHGCTMATGVQRLLFKTTIKFTTTTQPRLFSTVQWTLSKKHHQEEDSQEYLEKVHFFKQFIQMYGRQAVRDALSQHPTDLKFHTIHVHNQSKTKGIIPEILSIAQEHSIPVKFYSDERKLMIISKAKNESIVQGIVADVKPVRKDLNITVNAFIEQMKQQMEQQRSQNNREDVDKNENTKKITGILALDSVMTPKNIGVILRTVAASGIDACLLPSETEGQVSVFHPEVIRTSTGTVFRTKTIRCERRKKMKEALCQLVDDLGALVLVLSPPTKGRKPDQECMNLFDLKSNENLLSQYSCIVYVIGSETEGISRDIIDLCSHNDSPYGKHFKLIHIPMASNVESLNASAAAALCCYEHFQIASNNQQQADI